MSPHAYTEDQQAQRTLTMQRTLTRPLPRKYSVRRLVRLGCPRGEEANEQPAIGGKDEG